MGTILQSPENIRKLLDNIQVLSGLTLSYSLTKLEGSEDEYRLLNVVDNDNIIIGGIFINDLMFYRALIAIECLLYCIKYKQSK